MTIPNVSNILEGNATKMEFRLNYNLVSRLIAALLTGADSLMYGNMDHGFNGYIQVFTPPYLYRQLVKNVILSCSDLRTHRNLYRSSYTAKGWPKNICSCSIAAISLSKCVHWISMVHVTMRVGCKWWYTDLHGVGVRLFRPPKDITHNSRDGTAGLNDPCGYNIGTLVHGDLDCIVLYHVKVWRCYVLWMHRRAIIGVFSPLFLVDIG